MKQYLYILKYFLSRNEKLFNIISTIVFILVFCFHFYRISVTAVDLPFWDDWTFFPNDSPTWIFDFLNEHRTVPTKALIALQFWINGWDIRLTIISNFIIFGITIIFLISFLKWSCENVPLWAIILLSTCLFTPSISEVHHWGIGSIWHFVVLFGTIGVWLLFAGKSVFQKTSGVCFLLLSLYSTGQGLAFSAIAMAIWLASEALISLEIDKKLIIRKNIKSAGIGIVYLIGLALWFWGFRRIPSHAAPAGPWTAEFWNYFGLMIQNGLKFPYNLSFQIPWIGVIAYILLAVTPIIILIWRRTHQSIPLPKKTCAVIAMICGVSGVLFLTCYGRANFPIESATSGRYIYFTLFLIPLSVVLWSEIIFTENQVSQYFLLGICILFLGIQFRHGWRKDDQYDRNRASRLENLRIIADYYKSDGPHPLYLPDFWVPMDKFLNDAKEKNYSFYRKIQRNSIHDEITTPSL